MSAAPSIVAPAAPRDAWDDFVDSIPRDQYFKLLERKPFIVPPAAPQAVA